MDKYENKVSVHLVRHDDGRITFETSKGVSRNFSSEKAAKKHYEMLVKNTTEIFLDRFFDLYNEATFIITFQ